MCLNIRKTKTLNSDFRVNFYYGARTTLSASRLRQRCFSIMKCFWNTNKSGWKSSRRKKKMIKTLTYCPVFVTQQRRENTWLAIAVWDPTEIETSWPKKVFYLLLSMFLLYFPLKNTRQRLFQFQPNPAESSFVTIRNAPSDGVGNFL